MELLRKVGATIVAGVVLALAFALLWRSHTERSAASDAALDGERQTKLAAMDRIDAESRGAPAVPPAQGPPVRRGPSSVSTRPVR